MVTEIFTLDQTGAAMTNIILQLTIGPNDNEDLRNGYIWMIEGEFGIGESSFSGYRGEVFRGVYKSTRYVYYPCDYDKATEQQRVVMDEWAIDGHI